MFHKERQLLIVIAIHVESHSSVVQKTKTKTIDDRSRGGIAFRDWGED